jgi:hypothetical protein
MMMNMMGGPIFKPAEEPEKKEEEGPRQRRSVFVPEQKMRMNIVAMILSVFVPWGMYVMISGTATFCMVYTRPLRAYCAYGCAASLCGILCYIAYRARRDTPDPTWYSYLAAATTIFCFVAAASGEVTCEVEVRPWLQLNSLGYRRGVDASRVGGENVMDVGIIQFNAGNAIDPDKTYHFKNGALYCVAPIVTNFSAPETQSYDFWVVGKDCCAIGTSDFRCGAWFGNQPKSGLRILDNSDLIYYRLAVQQAEGTYNIMAKHPIFLTWSLDPAKALSVENRSTFRNYLFGNGVAFVVAILFMVLASVRFAFIGRGPWKRPWWEDRIEQQMVMGGMDGMGGMGGYGGYGGYGGMGGMYGGMGGGYDASGGMVGMYGGMGGGYGGMYAA